MVDINLGQIPHTDSNEPLDVTNKALHQYIASGDNEDLATLLTNFNNEDFATDANLDEIIANLGDITDAAETNPSNNASNIALLKGLLTDLNSLDGKDFSTETTLAALKTIIDAVYDSTDDTIKTKQSGSIVSLNSDGSIASEQVKEYRCQSTDTKIDASTVPKYSYLIEVDTDNIYYSDGSSWVMK